MIKVYLLPVTIIDNTEHVASEELIHDALLLTTESPTIRKLIMNTTTDEDAALSAVATKVRAPTQAERHLYNSQVLITPPDPDTLRAEELLATSSDAITMPEIWELLRIYGKRLGFRF